MAKRAQTEHQPVQVDEELATTETADAAAPEAPDLELTPPPATLTSDDINAMKDAARQRLGTLEGRRQELAFEVVIGGENAERDLAAVEAEIAKAELELQRLGFAAIEHERREVLRLDEADYRRRRAALLEAQALHAGCVEAATRADEGVAAFFAAIVEYAERRRRIAQLLRDAGQPAGADVAKPNGALVEAAFTHARMERFDGLQGADLLGRFGSAGYRVNAEPLAEVEKRIFTNIGFDVYLEMLDASRGAPAANGDAAAVQERADA